MIPVPTTWAKGFDSPLIPSTVPFQTNCAALDLSDAAAKILDDIRFLVTSITDPPSEHNTTLKIRSTASWLLNKLEAMPKTVDTSEQDIILETIRLAALIHCRSVSTLTLISKLPRSSVSQLEELYATMRRVSLRRRGYSCGSCSSSVRAVPVTEGAGLSGGRWR